ncbi:hypothetical protein HK096_009315 [Nowakowskiella sp. JEL0078]|nr:hypothetical protein HK096_009315 [Nowakowskiella sp. JEL0078]
MLKEIDDFGGNALNELREIEKKAITEIEQNEYFLKVAKVYETSGNFVDFLKRIGDLGIEFSKLDLIQNDEMINELGKQAEKVYLPEVKLNKALILMLEDYPSFGIVETYNTQSNSNNFVDETIKQVMGEKRAEKFIEKEDIKKAFLQDYNTNPTETDSTEIFAIEKIPITFPKQENDLVVAKEIPKHQVKSLQVIPQSIPSYSDQDVKSIQSNFSKKFAFKTTRWIDNLPQELKVENDFLDDNSG